MTKSSDLQHIIKLRQEIHQHPEVSGDEEQTADRIADFIAQFNPDNIIRNLGGHGLVAQFKGKNEGPAVTIRAELDALPIQEINDFDYKSKEDHKGHLCGHDGHMMMVAALAEFLGNEKPERGTVNLLFQPAEETGQGAQAMLDDDNFQKIDQDYLFALHNLPGYEKKSIVIKQNTFASASKGIIIELEGKTSHAAEPENGISPAQAIAELIQKIKKLPETLDSLKDFSLVTIVHVKIGERAFGTTPGEAVLMATLRAHRDDDLKALDDATRKLSQSISKEHKLQCKIGETEVFSATVNDKACVDYIRQAADGNDLKQEELDEAFRWSEDFGLFTKKYKGAMFGLGSGKDTPALHNPDYDFPDDILPAGIGMFKSIIKKIAY